MKKLIYLFCITFFIGCSTTDDTTVIPDNNDPEDDDPINTSIIINTTFISEIKQTNAVSGGEITDNGGNLITERGVVWSISPNPTKTDSLSSDGSGNGLFTSSLLNLEIGTTYYVRAFATNSDGTGYGDELIFNTSEHNVFIGDVVLSSQQEVDDFGNAKYSKIIGSLTITGNDIINVDALVCLLEVTENMDISSNDALLNINGLGGLKRIDGSFFQIANNNSLENITGFNNLIFSNLNDNNYGLIIRINNNLNEINGFNNIDVIYDLKIIDNPSLTTISAFDSIITVQEDLEITGNVSLTGITDFNNLTLIGGHFIIANNSITDISGFNSLTTVESYIQLSGASIANITGLNNLTHINSNIIESAPWGLTIHETSLTSLSGFNNLEYIGGHFGIINNAQITTISGFNNLISIGLYAPTFNITDYGGLVIGGNPGLLNILGFENLTTIGLGLNIDGNYSLSNVTGFNNLITIGIPDAFGTNGFNNSLPGRLSFYYNSINSNSLVVNGFNNLINVLSCNFSSNQNLITIDGFNSLTTSSGSLTVIDNSALTNISAFTNLNTIDGLFIEGNSALTNIGFPNLTTIDNSLSIKNNNSLSSLNGLNNLVYIDNELSIQYNNSLSSLNGLNNLEKVKESFLIRGNQNLTNFNDLTSLVFSGFEHTSFYVRANPNLSDLCGPNYVFLYNDVYYVITNAYNPTSQDLINGFCN